MNPYLFSILHSFFGTGFLYKNSVAPLDVYTLWGTHQNKPGTRKKKRITIKLYELKDEIITYLVGASKFNHESSGN